MMENDGVTGRLNPKVYDKVEKDLENGKDF
jgi:hypothetical protein